MRTGEARGCCMHWPIEFNAINLALDAVWRFPACRVNVRRLATVAAEEARHFPAFDHLVLRYAYGNFAAHNGL